MLNTVRAILESKGFNFEEGIIGRANFLETKKDEKGTDHNQYLGTDIIYSNSDPILDKPIPFDTKEKYAIMGGTLWLIPIWKPYKV